MPTASERARRARHLETFEVFNKAFTRSRPVRRALRDGYLSVEHPARALQSLRDEELAVLRGQKLEAEEAKVSGVPPELLELVSKQRKEDGKWPVDDTRLEEILGSGHGVPDPPDGITRWKWTLALCVAYLRRHATHFDHVHDAHERAMFYLSDHTLLEKAKTMLPPKELKVTIDKELVRQGRWHDAVEQLLSRLGHEAFLSVKDASHDSCPAEAPGDVQSNIRQNRSDQRQLSSETIQRTLFRATTLHEIGMARFAISEAPDFRSGQDTAVLNAHAPLAEALPLYSNLADQLSIDNERDLRAIQGGKEQLSPRRTDNANTKETQPQTLFARPQTPKVTGNPLVDADEELRTSMQSLIASGAESEDGLVDALVRHEESLAKELDLLRRRDHLGAVAAAAKLQKHWSKPLRQKAELRRLGRATQPVPRPEWSLRHLGALGNQRIVPRSSRKQLQQQKAKADRASASLQRDLGLDVKAELASTVPSASTAAHHEDVPLNVRLRQERLYDQVQRKLQTAIKRAILYTRLVDALKAASQANALRYRNAETHAARNHAFDQTTKLVVEIRLATCSLLEGITQWRQARNELAQSTDASHVPQMYPFIWDGGNLIVRMQRRLDFLRENKELSHWYGDAMQLEENPFMLAVPIRERPESPRQATRRVLVDGKQVLRVSEKLAALREQDVARMNAAWARVSGGPLWWPRCSNDEWIRVRAAEKVIRSEMERHDQLRAKLCG